MVVDPVLRIRRAGRRLVQPRQVGLVLAEQQGGGRTAGAVGGEQLQLAEERVADPDRGGTGRFQPGLGRADVPRPGVAEPGGRQHVQRLGVRSGVGDPHIHQDVARVGLGVADLDDPVPVAVERPGVEELVLWLEPVTRGVGGDQIVVRELALRVVVPPAVPGVTGQRVEVPPVLLDVLAVVALRPGQPEGALLEDGIAPVPQGQPQAQPLLDVAEAGQPVLAPPVGPGPGVIVREVVPRRAVDAVVLANGPPLALRQVRAPQVPVAGLPEALLQRPETLNALSLRVHHASLYPSEALARPLPRCGAPNTQVWATGRG